MGRERGKGEKGCSRFDPPPIGRLFAAFSCSSGGFFSPPPAPWGGSPGAWGYGVGRLWRMRDNAEIRRFGAAFAVGPEALGFCLPEDRRAPGRSRRIVWLVLACFGLLLVFFLNSIRRPRAPGGGASLCGGGRSAVFPLGSGAAWGEGPAQIGRAARLGRTLISGGRRGFAGLDFVFICIFISICNCFLQSFFLFSFFFGLFFY